MGLNFVEQELPLVCAGEKLSEAHVEGLFYTLPDDYSSDWMVHREVVPVLVFSLIFETGRKAMAFRKKGQSVEISKEEARGLIDYERLAEDSKRFYKEIFGDVFDRIG